MSGVDPATAAEDLRDKVRRARRLYLRDLAVDPDDTTGLVAEAGRLYYRIFEQVEKLGVRTRLEPPLRPRPEDPPAPGGLRGFGLALLEAFRVRDRSYHTLIDWEQDALTEWEWRAWVDEHRLHSERAAIDHLASLIPRTIGEPYADYRGRLARRRESWRAGRTARLLATRIPSAPPSAVPPRSPARRRTRGGPKGRRPAARPRP